MSWQHTGEGLARPAAAEPRTLASDADRDAAAGLLNEAFAEGRLTADEHGERVRAAYAARSWPGLPRTCPPLLAARPGRWPPGWPDARAGACCARC